MALRALDCGLYEAGEPVDVLVARATLYSLGLAQHDLAATPRPPVLAIVGELPGSTTSGPTRARLKMTESEAAGVVFVPYVPDWIDEVLPHEAALASGYAADPKNLGRPERAFAAAIRQLIELVSPIVMGDPAPALPSSADFLSEHDVPLGTFLDPHLHRRSPKPMQPIDEDDLPPPPFPKFTGFHSR
jgi:hypothetical protein